MKLKGLDSAGQDETECLLLCRRQMIESLLLIKVQDSHAYTLIKPIYIIIKTLQRIRISHSLIYIIYAYKGLR